MLGKTESRKRKGGATKDEMVGQHHQLNAHETVKHSKALCAAVYEVSKSQTQLSD